MQLDIEKLAGPCSCGRNHELAVKKIIVREGALDEIKGLLTGYNKPVILCDQNTKAAVSAYAAEIFDIIETVVLSGDGFHADNAHVDYIEERLSDACDMMLAVGSGTIRLTNKNAQIDYQYIPKTEDVKWVTRDVDWLIANKEQVLEHWNKLYTENY